MEIIQIDMKITYSEGRFDFITVHTRFVTIQFIKNLRIQNVYNMFALFFSNRSTYRHHFNNGNPIQSSISLKM